MALVLEVAGEPCDVEPDGVVDASPTEHDAPDGALAKEDAPCGFGSEGGGRGFGFCEGRVVIRSIRAPAVEGDPGGGYEEAGSSEHYEHAAPADAEHDPGEDGWREGEAEVLGGAHEARGFAAGGGSEPLAGAADAGWVERGFADAEENAQRDEAGEGADEAYEHLCGRPEDESAAEHGASSGAV